MQNRVIKICGVRSTHMAQAAICAGADLIGIVSHPNSKRFVDLETASKIAQSVYAVNGMPVAVFVDQNAVEMQLFCQETGIEIVQLHGDRARHAHHLLPDHYQRIYVCSVEEKGLQHLQGLAHCDVNRDYVLFDSACPGSGQAFAWDKLEYKGPFRRGIAGGLHPKNVKEAIQILKPSLVDVSSGVEDSSEEKSIGLIKEFIEKAR